MPARGAARAGGQRGAGACCSPTVQRHDEAARSGAFPACGGARTMSTVDVLIPTCDRAGALAVTLSSLCAQEFRDFRVVVSDQSEQGDVRRDGSVLAACRVLESHGCPVILLRHLPRRGMAEQRQFLLDQASASWVLCLDDDLIIEPYVLGLLTKLMHRERCGFIGSACIGLSYLHDMRPHEQHVIFWEGPVAPEEVKWGSEAWQRARLHNAANL